MARVEGDAFGDRELARVFMAATVAEARRAEALLTERGVDYVVRAEPLGRSLFGSLRMGAAFYVEVQQAQYCGSLLVAEGFGLGVLIDPES